MRRSMTCERYWPTMSCYTCTMSSSLPPHNAFSTREAVERILNTAIDNITAFIDGEPGNKVNERGTRCWSTQRGTSVRTQESHLRARCDGPMVERGRHTFQDLAT
jgi:hypothetical protein